MVWLSIYFALVLIPWEQYLLLSRYFALNFNFESLFLRFYSFCPIQLCLSPENFICRIFERKMTKSIDMVQLKIRFGKIFKDQTNSDGLLLQYSLSLWKNWSIFVQFTAFLERISPFLYRTWEFLAFYIVISLSKTTIFVYFSVPSV